VPFLFLSLVLAAALSSAQTAPAGTQLGVAQVSGRIVEEGTNAPLSGAMVTAIAMPRGPVVSARIGPPPQAITDADGRYVLDGLPPGRYRIDAQRAGFASALADPAAFRTFEVAAGQALAGVNFSLLKGGVITGQILDPSSGEPLVGAMVVALKRIEAVGAPANFAQSGLPRLMTAGQSVQTNDLGEFRIFGLPPGEYFIGTSRPPNFGFATGSPLTRAGSPATAAAPGIGAVFTYYPGTADAFAAHPVTVAAGQVATGIVFRIVMAQTYQVSGTVVDQTGAPVAGASVMLRGDPRTGFGPWPGSQGRSDASGNFVIGGIPPGSYMAMASVPLTAGSRGASSGSLDSLPRIVRPVSGPEPNVTVTDGNVGGVQIVVQLPSR
jgi:hypothetical protein